MISSTARYNNAEVLTTMQRNTKIIINIDCHLSLHDFSKMTQSETE